MHFRHLLAGSAALALLGAGAPTLAAIPSNVSYTVGVCNPLWPQQCIQAGPFTPDALSTVTIASVSTSSSRVQLTGTGGTVLVSNTGATAFYVKLGGSTVTAATTDFYVPAGAQVPLARGTNTYIAAITASSTSTLVASTGNGTPAGGSGGGSSGGGGGSASYTAASAPYSVAAGVNKPAGISTTNSAQWQIPVKPGTTTEIDLSSPSGVLGSNGSTIMAPANPLNVGGGSAAGATQADIPIANGCRAASATPTAVTDGQKVNSECDLLGASVTRPYAIKELQVRGSTGAVTGTSQTSIIASAGGSLKNYITAIQCANSGSTTSILTFTDAAATVLINPAGGGGNWNFPVPLVTAAATAFQVTPGSASTSQYCSAQGYTGL